jgi:subtilisin family serine protease
MPALAQNTLRTVEFPVADRYLVVLKPEAARLPDEARNLPGVAELASEVDTFDGVELRHVYRSALRGFAVQASPRALKRLLADPRVEYVEQDAVVWVDSMQSRPAVSWGQDRIDQRSPIQDGRYSFYRTGAGVRVYVIDSGINATHSEFAGRIGPGYAGVADGRGTGDCIGHGSHVAGTIGGATAGVAPGVILHPVRVFGCAMTSEASEVIAGIDWVAANRQLPAVANLSFNSRYNASLDAAVSALIARGVSTVVSAGNGNDDACYLSPSRVWAALTVGATDSDDRAATYSNVGACIDLYAPGSDIVSAAHDHTTAFADRSGTSMATAHVSGVAALHLEDDPASTPAEIHALVRSAVTIAVTSPYFGGTGGLAYTQGDDLPRVLSFQRRNKLETVLVKLDVVVPAGEHQSVEIPLPPGWVAIGGGVEGDLFPHGHLITASHPNADRSAWVISTRQHLAPAPTKIRGWVIGLSVANLYRAQLLQHIAVVQSTSNPTQHPQATAYLPSGFVLLGGGFYTDTRGPGMLATGSWPEFPTTGPRVPGWTASAKDHLQISPGTVTAFAIGIREYIPGVGRMESFAQTAVSDPAPYPEASLFTDNAYVRTGCGAKAHWTGAGSLLWRIEPILHPQSSADAGCRVSAKEHLVPDPSAVQAWSIGLRAF